MIKPWYSRDHGQLFKDCFFIITNESSILGTSQESSEPNCHFDDDSDIGLNFYQTQTWKDVSICEPLTTEKNHEICDIIEERTRVFTDAPGRTHRDIHLIKTKSSKGTTHKAYRLPYALKDKVKAELDAMLDMGIIEPIVSSYASPLFALHKSDGQLRLITDFRALNKITEFDPYVIPRIDEILDEVSKARYISTLDLTKDFYQIPWIQKQKGSHLSFVLLVNFVTVFYLLVCKTEAVRFRGLWTRFYLVAMVTLKHM